jgi:hypothetical protein
MDDETLFHEQQYAPETPPNDVDWLAVLLELLPF